MSIADIFPIATFSKTEEEQIAIALTAPVVVKYLRSIAAEDVKELLGLSTIVTPDDQLVKAKAVVEGKLQVIATLLSMSA